MEKVLEGFGLGALGLKALDFEKNMQSFSLVFLQEELIL
jgi:hypothetical protein